MIRWARLSSIAIVASLLSACATSTADKHASIQFQDISEETGLSSVPSWKYGGPAIGDLDGDGDYDFALTNHHEVPGQLFEQVTPGKLTERPFPLALADLHGIAPGDYDQDGDLDLLIALGGGNGFAPRPPVLMRNDGWQWHYATEEAGLGGLGARGRAVRWLDVDKDGDLDILAINASKVVDEPGPRNLLYENIGGGQFRHRNGSEIEPVEAERVLVTDFNSDFIPDLVLFSPLSLWKGRGDFTFENVTNSMLRNVSSPIENVMAVAEADIDNDGDFDLYLARGKTYYELANNSLDFDAATGRFDLRDEGNRGRDGLSFKASGAVELSDFWHWKRRFEVQLPVYLGSEMRPIDEPTDPVAIAPENASGFPEEFPHNGWYLGHLGDGQWRLEWHLSGDLAWGMRASVSGVSEVNPDFEPQDRGVPDLLLVRDDKTFRDGSDKLPKVSSGNNWGVTSGDFDNDGRIDWFVHRFGKLRSREPDVLLQNTPDGFAAITDHGATSGLGHGDMGAALDFDGDGKMDLLNGDDNPGRWHLYHNSTENLSAAISVHVGRSPRGTDAYGALLAVETKTETYVRRIGSNGATHSQSLLDQQHVGIGKSARAGLVTVTWRDGTSATLADISAGSSISLGE
ncbi:CRTAC1 family protein [Erythrobacter sp. W53]|uniref:CRTAC1 family protein n=1 Tax=Erythrobacter sp. W53 TaxID=3425947 RepID=UPI003D768DC0